MHSLSRSFLIFFCAILLLSCSQYTKIEKSTDSAYKLSKADEYYAKKKYQKAQALYESLFSAYKGDKKFEDLYYKWAYTYFYLGMYPEAQNYFKGFLETFPNSPKAEEIDYMRAYSFYKQSPRLELEQVNTVKAMNMMQTFISQHPTSTYVKEATAVIDESRAKMESKDEREAKLYYNLGHFRAAALAYAQLSEDYPDSKLGDEYGLMQIKSYYKFAQLSIDTKKIERYESVTKSYQDFSDRYPDSGLLKEATNYNNLSITQIKELQNEQTSSSASF